MAKRKRREKKPRDPALEDAATQDIDNKAIHEDSEGSDSEEDQFPQTTTIPPVVDESNDVETSKVGQDEEPEPELELEADTEQRPQKKRRKEISSTSNVDDATKSEEQTRDPSKSRYILFVGNLPFDATTASIESHFSGLAPGFTVRHSTDKSSGKSKGFAFLEFENDEIMRRCLKGYHQSMFYTNPADRPAEDQAADVANQAMSAEGIHPSRLQRMSSQKPSKQNMQRNGKPSYKDKGRRINIELTAGGGGGKSEARKQKLREKNDKLNKERARIRDTRMKIAERTEKNRLMNKPRRKKPTPGATGANAGAVSMGKKRKFDD